VARTRWYAAGMDDLSSILGLAAAFGLDQAQSASLTRYADLILAWQGGNVTALRSAEDVMRTLLGDSLALLAVPALQARSSTTWLDLGAGAGVPGIPLAVAMPEARLTLLDAAVKKCAFLEEAVAAAGLAGRAGVVCARSERFGASGQQGREAFAVVLARAVAPLPTLLELAAPLLAVGGVLLASKTGKALAAEGPGGDVAAQQCGLAARPPVPLPRSPLDDAVCAVFEKVGPTPGRLPRREGVAAKRPLGA